MICHDQTKNKQGQQDKGRQGHTAMACKCRCGHAHHAQNKASARLSCKAKHGRWLLLSSSSPLRYLTPRQPPTRWHCINGPVFSLFDLHVSSAVDFVPGAVWCRLLPASSTAVRLLVSLVALRLPFWSSSRLSFLLLSSTTVIER